MSRPAIKVEGMGKRYKIGLRENTADSLREAIVNVVKSPWRRLQHLREHSATGEDIFWALEDVNFEVKPGEVLGVIGRNGAGKSTLLKILSRITEPTTGLATIYGRVGSLLEVGTGFHPDLTGRENIFLNGAILGMKKAEIKRVFDDIIAFAEVEKFLDTPVKRYSSGMRVRLGFAVAAHLNPDILIVDEVLAVGDVAFQKKCLNKMDDVATAGRTVIFVSHNMAAVQRLCTRGIVLEAGRCVFDGTAAEATENYIENQEPAGEGEVELADRPLLMRGQPHISKIRTLDSTGEVTCNFIVGEPFVIEAELDNLPAYGFSFTFMIFNWQDVCVYQFRSQDAAHAVEIKGNKGVVRLSVPELNLVDGTYRVTPWLGDAVDIMQDKVEHAIEFHVINRGSYASQLRSVVFQQGQWETEG